jgi:hypothetical protein
MNPIVFGVSILIFGLLMGTLITMPGTATAYNLLSSSAQRKSVKALNTGDIKTPLILTILSFLLSLALAGYGFVAR